MSQAAELDSIDASLFRKWRVVCCLRRLIHNGAWTGSVKPPHNKACPSDAKVVEIEAALYAAGIQPGWAPYWMRGTAAAIRTGLQCGHRVMGRVRFAILNRMRLVAHKPAVPFRIVRSDAYVGPHRLHAVSLPTGCWIQTEFGDYPVTEEGLDRLTIRLIQAMNINIYKRWRRKQVHSRGADSPPPKELACSKRPKEPTIERQVRPPQERSRRGRLHSPVARAPYASLPSATPLQETR